LKRSLPEIVAADCKSSRSVLSAASTFTFSAVRVEFAQVRELLGDLRLPARAVGRYQLTGGMPSGKYCSPAA
jgi:hypothetical protein